MATPPQQVYSDRYEPERLIARGGMAEVWLARDALLDRHVALKVLFPELSTDPNFVERFRREAQSAANLSHPNIVSVYDWGEAGGTYFIVMEYVEGRPLSAVLREDGPLSADRAAAIAADVAAALGFAHRNGVIHRDVKPGNVLITADDHVKVTDFGIARASNTEDHLTQTGAVMGTATYFSPEQAQGLPVDQRSDVYALGVVLYEMVAGKPPFVADGPVAVAYKHVHEDPVPPSSIVPAIPAPFEAIILQAMAKDLAHRYATAEELRADLVRFRQGRSVLAEVPPHVGHASAGLGAAAVGAAALAGAAAAEGERTTAVAPGTGAAAALRGVPPAANGREATGATRAVPVTSEAVVEEDHRSSGTWFLAGLLVVLLAALAVVLVLLGRQLDLFGAKTKAPTQSAATVVTVPSDLVGKSYADAVTELQGLGLGTKRTDVADNRPVDTVIAISPPAGQKVNRGGLVELAVSSGASTVLEPDVTGTDVPTATQRLQAAGFTVGRVTTASAPNQASGVVITQDPPAGTSGHKGDPVNLTVSAGNGQVLVPDVTGQDQTEAANELTQAGLRFTYGAKEGSATVAAGNVIRTNPPAGSSVAKGATVTIIVSSGPAKVRVPYVRGLNEADARAAIESKGLVATESFQQVAVPTQDGKVIDQSPAGGATVEQGATVNLVIGRFSPVSGSSTTTTTKP
ncbi:MAG: Stk1 family PASTA domain-containing Ser/Thr kinase [Acidimicrobiales bacterium]